MKTYKGFVVADSSFSTWLRSIKSIKELKKGLAKQLRKSLDESKKYAEKDIEGLM